MALGGKAQPFVVAALEAEKNKILTAIIKTEQKLSIFEKKFNVSTSDFMMTGHQETLQMSEMEAIEWYGEHETLKKLKEKLSRLQEIEICT